MRRCRAAPVDAAPIVAKETRLDKGLPSATYPRLPSRPEPPELRGLVLDGRADCLPARGRPGPTGAAPYSDRHRRLPPSVTTFPICCPGGKWPAATTQSSRSAFSSSISRFAWLCALS